MGDPIEEFLLGFPEVRESESSRGWVTRTHLPECLGVRPKHSGYRVSKKRCDSWMTAGTPYTSYAEIVKGLHYLMRNEPVLELQRQLESLRRVVLAQDARIESQGQTIASLRAVVFPEAPEEDDFDRWISSEEAAKHAGEYVAYLPGEGPIIISPDLKQLMAELSKHPRGDKAGIAIIPCQTQTI